ncbi:MAG: hypothetical protein FWG77_03960 [Treponema sp.]|nr:hypothetical protein [Treponema sp.]
MKNIILITRENNEVVTQVSVYLCNNHKEVKQFCRFINSLSLDGGEKLAAREIFMNREYNLEKYVPLTFEDILKVKNRMIQKIMRELDMQMLAIALYNANQEIKDHILQNMSQRATAMLKEDMDYMDIPSESEIEEARELVLDILNFLSVETFDESFNAFDKMVKKTRKKHKSPIEEDDDNSLNIVLVFRGTGNVSSGMSISIFDSFHEADNFCNFMNELKQAKGNFIYARHAKQMVEYETTKPLVIRFEQVLEYNSKVRNEYQKTKIIREAFKKIGPDTLFMAFKGLDKRSRELLMQSLPIKTTDAINEKIGFPDTYDLDLFTLSETRRARQKIIDSINKNTRKFERNVFPWQQPMIKC